MASLAACATDGWAMPSQLCPAVRRSAMTDADGGAPASALRPEVTCEPAAAVDAIGSPLAAVADALSWSWASAAGDTDIGGSAAPWNEIWSFSAGRYPFPFWVRTWTMTGPGRASARRNVSSSSRRSCPGITPM